MRKSFALLALLALPLGLGGCAAAVGAGAAIAADEAVEQEGGNLF